MGFKSIHGVLVLILCWAATATQVDHMKYKDPKQPLNVRIQDLMKRMTLAEKIGQMTQIERVVANHDVMKQYFIGSILSGGGSAPRTNASAKDWMDMVYEFQQGALSSRLGIPMIYGIDAVHGHNNVYNATIFPHNVGLGVTRDPKLLKKIGAATALEVRATGIQYAFAPCIAVCRDPRWGRCYESYSEDPKIVQAMTEIIPGLQGDIPSKSRKGVPFVAGKKKVAACAKHYLGDGGTHTGINENDTIIDAHGLFSIHMPAYYNSIIKGVSTVMVSYSSWNGKKMHSNHELVTDLLKNRLRFRGFVISDWQGIDRLTYPIGINYTYSVEAAVSAGLDMIMVPYDYTSFIGNLTYLIKSKVIPMSRIDDAVRRILRVKFTMDLFENPLPDRDLLNKLGCKEHRNLAREAVRKSLVLLKNNDMSGMPVLPLPKKASRILVAGTHADNLGYQCGGWTIQWQGVSGNNFTTGTTILSAVKSAVYPSTEVVFSQNPDADTVKSGHFSYSIVAVGEPPYAETNGDSSNLTLPTSSISTIENVCTSVKCVVVLITGRPVVIQPYLRTIDALVAAWLPGTEGQGVTDLLFGDYGFTGKLARTWFKNVEQLPMNVGDHDYDPLFPFGFGLETKPISGSSGLKMLRPKSNSCHSTKGKQRNQIITCFRMRHRSLCLFMIMLLSSASTQGEYLKYKDDKQPLKTRIKDLTGRMTLAEKIGQMTQMERVVATTEVMKQYSIGSVLSGGGSSPHPHATAKDWMDMITKIQKAALSSPLGIPMIYGIDAVHGHNNVYNATIFPHNVGLGVSRQVCRDPRWGRCYESYSEDHTIVEALTDIIPGLQGDIPSNAKHGVPYVAGKDKVAACAKHYVGDGGTHDGINENNTIIDFNGLFSIHMPAYRDSIRKGVSTVMVSFSSWNGEKMHSNYHLITEVLKRKLHFKGFVISDWQGIDKLTYPIGANYTYSVEASIKAGLDMIMVPYDYIGFIGNLTHLVESKVIPMRRINDAVKRIMTGVHVVSLRTPSRIKPYSMYLDARSLAREAVRKSLVLLKNGDSTGKGKPLLPLPKKATKILVADTHADNLAYQCGGWTIEWQGVSGNNLTSGTTILGAIKSAVDPSTNVVFSENPETVFVKNGNFSYAVVVVGETPYVETMGDSKNLTLPQSSLSVIQNVCTSVRCMVILITGRPVVAESYLPVVDALVAVWLPGTEGEGIIDVLYGDYGFTGKLARTWFKRVDQLPMNVGDEKYDPLFPFGFGLTTTPVTSN